MTMTMNEAITRKKTFNTSGLCFPEDHYMVNPLKRMQEVEQLIDQKLYFTLHAPRQTGKTTYLHALARKLNTEGKYIALVVSFEEAGYRSIPVKEANDKLINSIYQFSLLQLPIVLLIDEIDALLDDVLISVLRQLRSGYQNRPGHFPSSVVLIGLRDVREVFLSVPFFLFHQC
jgi:predicted AAA+ superfamily ATPase